MTDAPAFFHLLLDGYFALLAVYFIAGNGGYTLLMFLSLVSVWLHKRSCSYEGLQLLRQSPATPPVTVIMPAWNEEDVIVDSVRSILKTDYPGIQVCVVDDGSSDATLERLIDAFKLAPAALIYRPRFSTSRIRGFFVGPELPNLLVISKEKGGKPDALNTGLNMCRTPYFCTLDSDCILEPDALLRLMWPVVHSPVPIVASGGIVRVLNGCSVADGHVVKIDLPPGALERFQVVEYLRSFLFGRTAWNLLGGTVIVSGAFALFHCETVVEAGGFLNDTVTEDMELVVRLRRWAAGRGKILRTNFTSNPVCWAQCPKNRRMLARQRRRWQLGLCQTLWKHRSMVFNPAFGTLGLASLPFHVLVEVFGALVEPLGYLIIPFVACVDPSQLRFLVPLLALGLAYAGLLSVSAVVLEEMTHRRYRSTRHLAILLFYALIENIGYRQLVLWYRFQGVVRFLTGNHRWEKVVHVAAGEPAARRLAGCGKTSGKPVIPTPSLRGGGISL
jgi:cellulose synthase/poly-beta-1,6-N-acetylglucosamine synthase-like glycosyltransferase